MRTASRSGVMVLSGAAVVLLGALSLSAQESPSSKTTPRGANVKRSNDPARRVPDYFGEIGLTPEQKESIYKIRKQHLQKIDELQKQIDAAKSAMLVECETVLTDAQKELLKHRRRAAVETKSPDTAKKATEPAK